MLFEFTEVLEQRAKMKVVGVGGAGGNARASRRDKM